MTFRCIKGYVAADKLYSYPGPTLVGDLIGKHTYMPYGYFLYKVLRNKKLQLIKYISA